MTGRIDQSALPGIMRRTMWVSTLALCLTLGASAGLGAAVQPGEKLFDLANGRLILDVLADADAALSADFAVRQRAWRAAGELQPKPEYPTLDCAGAGPAVGAIEGVVCLRVSPRSASAKEPAKAELELRFADGRATTAFRAAIDQRFGASDSACSDPTRAHWSLKPGLSLRWRAESYHPEIAAVTLIDSDPPDANCAVTAAPAGSLVDAAAFEAFLKRLRDDPAPWRDGAAMEAWLESYGAVSSRDVTACDVSIWLMPPSRMGGFASINGVAGACPAKTPPPRIHLLAGDADMFGAAKARKAVRSVYGAADAACSNADREAWRVSDDQYLFLIPLWPSFTILVTNAGAETLDCR